jgi:hypothetical protein
MVKRKRRMPGDARSHDDTRQACTSERREHERRVPTRDLHGKLSARGLSLALWAKIVNISSVGICILVNHRLPEGIHFRLELRGSGNHHAHVLHGQVVHHIQAEHGTYLTGCVLEKELAEKDIEAILG